MKNKTVLCSATEIVIIGCGPAGISAAIQLKRAGYQPIVFEKSCPGGLLVNAQWIDNYPGFPSGISGKDLTAKMTEQLLRFQITPLPEEVILLDIVNFSEMLLFFPHLADNRTIAKNSPYFVISTKNTNYYAQKVIIATGTVPIPFPVIQNAEVQSAIFTEIAAIREVKGKQITIVGAGDAAFDYSVSLSPNNHIILLNRGTSTHALPVLVEKITHNPRIKYMLQSEIVEVTSANNQLQLRVQTKKSAKSLITCDILVVAIGRKPNLSFISSPLQEKLAELIKEKFLYLIGDVKNDHYRQAGIAVGDGLQAAMEITGCLRH